MIGVYLNEFQDIQEATESVAGYVKVEQQQ